MGCSVLTIRQLFGKSFRPLLGVPISQFETEEKFADFIGISFPSPPRGSYISILSRPFTYCFNYGFPSPPRGSYISIKS